MTDWDDPEDGGADDFDGLDDHDELEESATSGAISPAQRTGSRPAIFPDALYGTVRLSWWAAALVSTPPFQRLRGISLSDVPGEWLFACPFPTRLEHTLGVYHLTRLARPRDRALQAAALLHDLGHGPFSHLSESLMRERLGLGHEARSAVLADTVREALTTSIMRRMSWLDWDEVAALLRGEGERAALLAGRLDFDNADNVARFLQAAELGAAHYDPVLLARALRPLPATLASAGVSRSGRSRPLRGLPTGERRRLSYAPVYLMGDAQEHAEGWQRDRATVYAFLHDGHRNVATHAMLRKALDLAACANLLPRGFFDLTDEGAYQLLAGCGEQSIASLAEAARAGRTYACVWEAETPARHEALHALLRDRRSLLALEARLAAEAGLGEHEVVVEGVISAARRALPPIAPQGRPEHLVWLPEPLPAPRVLHVLAARGAPRDYLHRLRTAAERHFAALGVNERHARGSGTWGGARS